MFFLFKHILFPQRKAPVMDEICSAGMTFLFILDYKIKNFLAYRKENSCFFTNSLAAVCQGIGADIVRFHPSLLLYTLYRHVGL